MRAVFYAHSVTSDWNNGNAHFLRGIVRELVRRGHDIVVAEPAAGWSLANLLAERGRGAIAEFEHSFPEIRVLRYDAGFDHDELLDTADLVIVHEWTEPALLAHIGAARRSWGSFTLLFHDTHHRSVSAQDEIFRLPLADCDGVLVFGATLRERYMEAGWGRQAHTWHEAADVSIFHPRPVEKTGDLIWIGNWGDDERSAEITEFLVEPARQLALKANVHGVRYPPSAIRSLGEAHIGYHGWIANAEVPKAFAAHHLTLHIPRRPYRRQLPGVPTIRVFEALACGIPLVSAPWDDVEALFRPGIDFLFAHDGGQMRHRIEQLLADSDWRTELARKGRETILARHTCAHRVDELLRILAGCGTRRLTSEIEALEVV
ncbi:MAG: CgeB family protein [Pseudomonadota bacterium]